MSAVKAFTIWLPITCGVLYPFLDEGIIATAVPQITEDFHSLPDIGWYGSSYLLTLCAFQLLFGRLYSLFSIKVIFLASLAIFETGSLICATSLSSQALIAGRAVAGCGAAGLMSGTIALFAAVLPADNLALYVGGMGVVYGVAAVVGPVVGGVITGSRLGWRWCFYINLPFALPPLLAVLLLIKIPPKPSELSLLQRIKELDYIGMVLLVPSITLLLVALQFGGALYSWSDARTIGLLVATGVLAMCFVAWQWHLGEAALVPPRIISMRIVFFGAVFTFFLESAFLTLVYYLPMWFQTIQHTTPSQSGIRYLALCIPFTLSILLSGWLVSRRPTAAQLIPPFMLGGAVLVAVGSGLLSTLDADAGAAEWIPFQAVAGLGIGLSTEQAGVAVQTTLAQEGDAPLGLAVVLFAQNLGPAVSLSVANAVFARGLKEGVGGLGRGRVPEGLDVGGLVDAGAMGLWDAGLDGESLGESLGVYNRALTRAFVVAAVMGAASVVGVVGVWRERLAMFVKGTTDGVDGTRHGGRQQEMV